MIDGDRLFQGSSPVPVWMAQKDETLSVCLCLCLCVWRDVSVPSVSGDAIVLM